MMNTALLNITNLFVIMARIMFVMTLLLTILSCDVNDKKSKDKLFSFGVHLVEERDKMILISTHSSLESCREEQKAFVLDNQDFFIVQKRVYVYCYDEDGNRLSKRNYLNAKEIILLSRKE